MHPKSDQKISRRTKIFLIVALLLAGTGLIVLSFLAKSGRFTKQADTNPGKLYLTSCKQVYDRQDLNGVRFSNIGGLPIFPDGNLTFSNVNPNFATQPSSCSLPHSPFILKVGCGNDPNDSTLMRVPVVVPVSSANGAVGQRCKPDLVQLLRQVKTTFANAVSIEVPNKLGLLPSTWTGPFHVLGYVKFDTTVCPAGNMGTLLLNEAKKLINHSSTEFYPADPSNACAAVVSAAFLNAGALKPGASSGSWGNHNYIPYVPDLIAAAKSKGCVARFPNPISLTSENMAKAKPGDLFVYMDSNNKPKHVGIKSDTGSNVINNGSHSGSVGNNAARGRYTQMQAYDCSNIKPDICPANVVPSAAPTTSPQRRYSIKVSTTSNTASASSTIRLATISSMSGVSVNVYTPNEQNFNCTTASDGSCTMNITSYPGNLFVTANTASLTADAIQVLPNADGHSFNISLSLELKDDADITPPPSLTYRYSVIPTVVSNTGTNIWGASVTLTFPGQQTHSCTTGSTGACTPVIFFSRYPGQLTLQVTAAGYASSTKTQTLFAAGDYPVSITLQSILPVVTTLTPTGLTRNSIQPQGNIISIGGSAIIKRGFQWRANSGYAYSTTYDIPFLLRGFGPGPYTKAPGISGLTPGTTYWIRAFVVNAANAYAVGSWISFKTLP